jgi:hypothetical protein
MEKQRIMSVEIDTAENRLRVYAHIDGESFGDVKAELPQREVSTLLPRDVLLGEEQVIRPEVLEVIRETLEKLLTGRHVRVWEYDDRRYFGFPSWRSVKTESLLADPVEP